MLPHSDPRDLPEALERLSSPVRLVLFTQTFGCESCPAAHAILREVAASSDLVTVEEYNFQLDKTEVATFGIERVPAIAVVGDRDVGIRFYGAPDGWELMALVEAMQLVSEGRSSLSDESRALIGSVTAPLSIQVFVTPT